MININQSAMCLISFIVPVYNLKKEEISECISSIATQGVIDYEIIIVDDGSESDIADYCEYIGKQYGAKVVHQRNQGLAVARNAGMQEARGEWIVHVDGDDWVSQELVESFSRISETDADIVVWGYVIKNQNRQQKLLLKNKSLFNSVYSTIKERVLCSILDYDDSFASLALNTSWGKAYRRSFIQGKELFYNPSLRRAQDAVYNLYAFNEATKVVYIDKALSFYRADNVSLSRGFNPRTYEYLSQTAMAVERFVEQDCSSSMVKVASSAFIERCFRMITVQYYQHKDNPMPYHDRRKLFMEGIQSEPFKKAFSISPVRSGLVNRITDYLYRHRSFFGIAVFNETFGLAYKVKTLLNKRR